MLAGRGPSGDGPNSIPDQSAFIVLSFDCSEESFSREISRGGDGDVLSGRFSSCALKIESSAMNVPVLPTPALHPTTIGGSGLRVASGWLLSRLHASTNFMNWRRARMSEGTP